MADKATFCPRCQGMRIGIHGKDHAQPPRNPKAEPLDQPKATQAPDDSPRDSQVVVAGVITGSQLVAGAKFDRAVYQREYMRRYRAKQKAK